MFEESKAPPMLQDARATLETRKVVRSMMGTMLEGMLDIMLENEENPVRKASMTVLKKHMQLDRSLKRTVDIASPHLKGDPEKLLEAENAAIRMLDGCQQSIDAYLDAYPPENFISEEEETEPENPFASLFK